MNNSLGEGITRDHLDDDVLGRTLDAIAAYGPTELCNEIVAECLLPTEFGSHRTHVDTTNFSVTGAYEPDKETIRTIIENLKINLKTDEKVYYVADSAFYTAKNQQSPEQHTFWIRRVPVTIPEALDQTRADHSFSPCADERYAYREQFSEYAGIWQKWVLYRPTPMYEREEKTFEKNQGK